MFARSRVTWIVLILLLIISIGVSAWISPRSFLPWEGREPLQQTQPLSYVWSADFRAIAVGHAGTILYCEGNSWAQLEDITTNHLFDVWGSSSSDVFAVGGYGAILHYDGIAWRSVRSGTSNHLFATWGSSSSDVFAVGFYGTIVHYDGSACRLMDSGTRGTIRSVWGFSRSNVFAVGDGGTILHYDGSSWRPMDSGTTTDLLDLWGSSSSNLFAVGMFGTILRYDGTTWSQMNSGTANWLYSIAGSSPGCAFAVGTDGAILRYDGSSWISMASGTTNHLFDVCTDSQQRAFAAGYDGTIIEYDGVNWTSMSNGNTMHLYGINVVSATTLGVIRGKVHVDGDPIEGAQVELDGVDGTHTSTSSDGSYTIDDVPFGSYQVRATVSYPSDDPSSYRLTRSASVSQMAPSPQVDFEFGANLALIGKYAPVLYMSSGEQYYPCSFYFDGNLDVADNPTNYTSTSRQPPYHVYVHTWSDSQYFTIQYWLYYANNDHPTVQAAWANHEHDWECVYVVFDEDNRTKPVEVGFSQHGGMEYQDWDEASLKDGTHPISYVAMGSHANYFAPPPNLKPACFEIWVEPKEILSPSSFVYELAVDTSTWPSFTDKISAPWSRDEEWKKTRPLGGAWYMAVVCSPVELRSYDADGNVTGLVGGDIRTEIPGSYCEGNVVVLTDPSGSYRYEVVGTGDGSYDLTLAYYADSTTSVFSATEIPCSVGMVHRYTVDWDALSQGEKGVTVEIDSDGNGEFEKSITADSRLAGDEFASAAKQGGLPFWVWIPVGVGAVLMAGGLTYFIRRRLVRQ